MVVICIIDDDVLGVYDVVMGHRSLFVGAGVGGRRIVQALFRTQAPVVVIVLRNALVLGRER